MKLKRCLFLLAIFPVTCLATADVGGGVPLSAVYLDEAAHGKLDHVYLVRMFGGYLPIPRTFDVSMVFGESVVTSFQVNIPLDPSMKIRGTMALGIYIGDAVRGWQDPVTRRQLPMSPVLREHRGTLAIDFFQPEDKWPQRSVIISDKTNYLHLTGSAVNLTNALVKAFVTLNGPPSIFEPHWHSIERWDDLPNWAVAVSATESADWCEQRVLRLQPIVMNGELSGVRVFPGLDAGSFTRLGFRLGDVIKAIDGRPISVKDNLFTSLRETVRGGGKVFAIDRRGANVTLRIEPIAVKREFSSCWGD